LFWDVPRTSDFFNSLLDGGTVHPGAGAIADLYQKLGGSVTWIGKPYPDIYLAAARLVGAPSPNDVLCVGDSIEHDVVGARRFGAFAALLRTGVLSSLSDGELVAECARHFVMPDRGTGHSNKRHSLLKDKSSRLWVTVFDADQQR
jgi:ribonucleotide monophosphatase NagD (HAD superfamily)